MKPLKQAETIYTLIKDLVLSGEDDYAYRLESYNSYAIFKIPGYKYIGENS